MEKKKGLSLQTILTIAGIALIYVLAFLLDRTSIEKLISGWVASHAEVNLAKRYLEVTLTNIFQDIDMLPTVNYNVNALPMRRIGQH